MRDEFGRVKVCTDGTAGPYVMISPSLDERVSEALRAAGITFIVDRDAVRVDGQPAAVVFNFGTNGAPPGQIQAVLDEIE